MSPGGGELSLSVRPGVGNRTSSTQMPGGVPGGGGMVTGRIEPRITLGTTYKNTSDKIRNINYLNLHLMQKGWVG